MSWKNVQYENGKYQTSSGGGGASELADLDDVNLSSPSAGNALLFDDDTDEWVNGGVLTADVNGTPVPFRFHYDSTTQKYGYLDGADTFHPFNDGGDGNAMLYFENKYRTYSDPINYTYTVSEAGQYLVFGMRGDGNADGNPCIVTTGTVVFANSIDQNTRWPEVKFIDCQVGDTIQLSFNNYSGGAYRGTTAGIFLIKYGKVTSGQTAFCQSANDNSTSKNTQLGNNKLYFTLAIDCGTSNLAVSYSRGSNIAGISYEYSIYFVMSIDRSFGGSIYQNAGGAVAGAGAVMAVELEAISI